MLELALAFLYLEKDQRNTGKQALEVLMFVSLNFFIRCMKEIYAVPTEKIRCYLHLRADQSPEKMKRYWSKELLLPPTNFGKASIDKEQ